MELREIPNYSKYMASDDGRIWSKINNIFLKSRLQSRRLSVNVCNDDGERKSVYVHRLVCLAFHGEPDFYPNSVDHLDFNPLNNSPSNLEWCTIEENMRRYFDAKLTKVVFSPSQLNNIIEMYNTFPVYYIARFYNVSSSVIKYTLEDCGVYDGRINYISGSARRKINKHDIKRAKELFETGKYNMKELHSVLGIDVSSSSLGYYMKDMRSRVYYRDKNIVSLYSGGRKISEISEEYGMKEYRVREILRAAGIKLRDEDIYKPNPEYGISDLDLFSKCVISGMTEKQLSDKFCVGSKAISTALNRVGLRLREFSHKKTFGKPRKYDYAKIGKMAKNMTQSEISRELGIPQPTVRRALIKIGITPKDGRLKK